MAAAAAAAAAATPVREHNGGHLKAADPGAKDAHILVVELLYRLQEVAAEGVEFGELPEQLAVDV